MIPAMTQPETQLLRAVLASTSRYVEFGSGGSTASASKLVGTSIISVDSSSEWLNKVSEFCLLQNSEIMPLTHFVDIGPVGDWGYPVDRTRFSDWRLYHETVWSIEDANTADTYMVDGRFRVACVMQIILRVRDSNPLIMIHDFSSRNQYHVVTDFLECVAQAQDLSVFRKKSKIDLQKAKGTLEIFKQDPA